MKKVLVILVLAFGLMVSSNAMAVHQCGQLLGSCLPHGIKTPVIKPPVIRPPIKPIKIEPVLRVRPRKNMTPGFVEKSDLQWCREYFRNTPRVQRNKQAVEYCTYLFNREIRGKIK